MNLEGKLIVKGETISYGTGGFTKREFVIETETQYPQSIQIELIKDKCALLEPFNIGDKINVSININGRKWINPEGVAKYFNSIQGWRIEKLESSAVDELPPIESAQNNEPDDLPF